MSSDFFWAVTTTSSICAKAGAASAVESNKALMNVKDRPVRTERIADILRAPRCDPALRRNFLKPDGRPHPGRSIGRLFVAPASRLGGTLLTGQQHNPQAPVPASFRSGLYPECHTGFEPARAKPFLRTRLTEPSWNGNRRAGPGTPQHNGGSRPVRCKSGPKSSAITRRRRRRRVQ